jgi:hypothetical protein
MSAIHTVFTYNQIFGRSVCPTKIVELTATLQSDAANTGTAPEAKPKVNNVTLLKRAKSKRFPMVDISQTDIFHDLRQREDELEKAGLAKLAPSLRVRLLGWAQRFGVY